MILNYVFKYFIIFSIFYTLYRILKYLFKIIRNRILLYRLDKGSENYLKFKDRLESCIKSGEINSYFEGFQFIKVDHTNDSEDMSLLQSEAVELTEIEKFKLKLVGKKLLKNL